MFKDYTEWDKSKTYLNNDRIRPNFNEKDVWFCSIGFNIGDEEDGKGASYMRPVVILKKFSLTTCLVIPLTKTSKTSKFYFNFILNNKPPSTAILSQIKLIDAKRLQYKYGRISNNDFINLKQKLIQLLV